MEINTYIKDILLVQEKAIVPGLGGFAMKYESAKISDTQTTFMPPRKKIMFDASMLEDDRQLTAYLVEKGDITEDTARQLIADFVNEAKEKLDNGERIYFDQVGTLYKDENKILSFEPDMESALLMETAGFVSFKSEVVSNPETTDSNDKKKGNNKGLLIIFLIVVVLLVLAYPFKVYVYDKYLKNKGKEPVAELIDSTPDTTTEVIDLTADTANGSQETVADNDNGQSTPADTEIIDESNKPNSDPSLKGQYFLIVGSFSQTANAESLRKELSRKGFKPRVLPKENNRYRVSAGAFADKASALKEKSKVAAKGYRDVWVLKK